MLPFLSLNWLNELYKSDLAKPVPALKLVKFVDVASNRREENFDRLQPPDPL